MKTYIAILRGVNVSGKTMIKMVELTKSMEAAGYQSVKTYIQSGNIVFKTDQAKEKNIAQDISALILKDFDATVPTLVITGDYLKSVIANNSFTTREGIDLKKLHITFLADIPEKERVSAIDSQKYLPDEFMITEKVIYLFCPNGYGTTKLSNNFFESKFKLFATTRNWATVNKLANMADEIEKED